MTQNWQKFIRKNTYKISLFPSPNSPSNFAGAPKFPIRRWADAARVLPRDTEREGHRAVVEEVDLQDHLSAGWSCAGIFQVSQLPGTVGIRERGRRERSCWRSEETQQQTPKPRCQHQKPANTEINKPNYWGKKRINNKFKKKIKSYFINYKFKANYTKLLSKQI